MSKAQNVLDNFVSMIFAALYTSSWWFGYVFRNTWEDKKSFIPAAILSLIFIFVFFAMLSYAHDD